jgi:ABC-type polysaccharide/polyol phosphate transport system ATPase subunit
LDGVTIHLKPGDRVGLIGRNGAGKSTLLRVIAGLTWPSSGKCTVEGVTQPLLSLGAGLNLDKSGLANILFFGKLMGLNRQNRQSLLEDVAEFAELGDFISLPVRSYSAGMSLRLAFGLATAFPNDILLIDEVIGAGDAFFVERARQRLGSLSENSKILVVASHSDAAIREFCNVAVWLDKGQIVDFGDPDEVLARYHASAPSYPGGTAFISQGHANKPPAWSPNLAIVNS